MTSQPLTVFHHVTELLVSDSTINSAVKLHHFLYLRACKLSFFANSQRQPANKLVLCDHPTTQFVVVFEELNGTHSIFVNSYSDFVKNLLQGAVCSWL